MFTKWDKRFDLLCGIPFRDEAKVPYADSSIKDWLYGPDSVSRFSERKTTPSVVQSLEPGSLGKVYDPSR